MRACHCCGPYPHQPKPLLAHHGTSFIMAQKVLPTHNLWTHNLVPMQSHEGFNCKSRPGYPFSFAGAVGG